MQEFDQHSDKEQSQLIINCSQQTSNSNQISQIKSNEIIIHKKQLFKQENQYIQQQPVMSKIKSLLQQTITIKKKYYKNYIKNEQNKSYKELRIQSAQMQQDIINLNDLKYEQNIYYKNENENESQHLENKIDTQEKDFYYNNNENQTQQCNIDEIFINQKTNQDYSQSIYKIHQELLNKNYTLVKFLDKGGQADIFDGYFYNNEGLKENCVFKIYYGLTNEDFQKEIEIMKSFESSINIVKIIDSIQIELFFILILEKCQFSLKQQLKQFNEINPFSFENLLQIIFDLLDGLIQFRIYHILHLDIKPGNILISKEGNYCYSDFGSSFNKKKNKEIKVTFFTKVFAAPEQLINSNVDYQSDVYSLGKTLKKVIDIFKKVNAENLENEKMQCEIIQHFENIIKENMIQNEFTERLECKNLHQQFMEKIKVEDYQFFFSKYYYKLIKLNKLYEYDQNKDIPYFLQLKLFYSETKLKIMKNYKNEIIKKYNLSLKKEEQKFDFQKNQNELFESILDENKQQMIEKINTYIIISLNNVGMSYRNLGRNQFALKYLLEQLDMLKQTFQQNHPNIAICLSNIGCCYRNNGEIQNALKYHLESLKMAKQIFQGIHPDIASYLGNVGLCYINLGDNQNGLKYQFESLQMSKQIFQGNHTNISASLNNIGLCYMGLGENQNSLKYHLESLEMRKQMFQGNHPDIAASLSNVGSCYKDLDQNQTGLKYQLESLKMYQQIYQGNHLNIAGSLSNVGNCYQKLGNNQNDLKYNLESLEMLKQIFQEKHPSIAKSLNIIGSCYENIGDAQNSLKYQLESLEMRKQIFQGNHPDIAQSLSNVGVCYMKLIDDYKGLKYQFKSLQMNKQIYQGNHQDISLSLYLIGSMYMNLNDYNESLRYLLESLEMNKQILEKNHILIAGSLRFVGMCYENIGEDQNSLKYHFKSLETFKQIYKGNHPDIADSLNNLGICFVNIGDNKNSLKYLLQSLDMYKQIFQENHPCIADGLDNVGICYDNLGESKNSLRYQLESLLMRKKIFGRNHIDIANSLLKIGHYYKNLGDSQKQQKYNKKSLEMKNKISKNFY